MRATNASSLSVEIFEAWELIDTISTWLDKASLLYARLVGEAKT
jgi:hypothetical protein